MPEDSAGGNNFADLLKDGYAYAENGNLAAAIDRYRDALALAPDDGEVLAALGLALKDAGAADEATLVLTEAVDRNPTRSDIVLALSELLVADARYTDAEDELRTFLRLNPFSRNVQYALARLLAGRKHFVDAVAIANQLFKFGETDREFRKLVASWMAEAGKHTDAIQLLMAVVRESYADAATWMQIGDVWAMVNEAGKARMAWENACRYESELLPQVRARIALLEAKSKELGESYIRALFDSHARRFDKDLADLSYQGPMLVRNAIDQVAAGRVFDIIDLGCGTGLAGLAFRERAHKLVGIDLSPRMLAQAEEKGIYAELHEGEIIATLKQKNIQGDLIIATDVLNYMGDLTPLFETISRILPAGGLFAATVELIPTGQNENYVLQEVRRYAHSVEYILEIAADFGLNPRHLHYNMIRLEKRKPVEGLVFVLEM